MSDFDYRMDGLESRISSLEGDLRSEISSERYETEREISSVEGRIRDLEDTVSVGADAARELRVEGLEENAHLNRKLQELRNVVGHEVGKLETLEEAINELHAQVKLLLEGGTHTLESIETLENNLATLALRCGIKHSTVKLGVERGKEGGS